MLQVVGCAIPRVLRCASSSNEAQKVSVRLAMQGLLGLESTNNNISSSRVFQTLKRLV